MKRTFLLLATLLTSIVFAASCEQPAANNANKTANSNANTNTASTSSASSEADVKKFVSDLAAAIGKNDAAALDKMMADDYTYITPDGQIMTKAQRKESMSSGAMKMDSISFDDVKVRMYGDTAVVTAKATMKAMMNGKDASGTSTAIIVLVKGKDGWQEVLGHPTSPPAAASTTANSNKPANANTASTNTNANKK
jgi:ketosteroid isomerase-like protein